MKNIFSNLGYKQHRVFVARSKVWSTSQRHTVSESTAMSFISCQYCWDYRHEQMNMVVDNNMLHLFSFAKQIKGAFHIYWTVCYFLALVWSLGTNPHNIYVVCLKSNGTGSINVLFYLTSKFYNISPNDSSRIAQNSLVMAVLIASESWKRVPLTSLSLGNKKKSQGARYLLFSLTEHIRRCKMFL